jgi:hypothetical protein
MYRRESKLRHVDLFYIGMISRSLEQINDILITVDDTKVVKDLKKRMMLLLEVVENRDQDKVNSFVDSVAQLEEIKVKDLKTYKKKKLYSQLGHIGESLTDWMVTEIVDN